MTSLCHAPFQFLNGARHRFFSVAVDGIATIPSALGYSPRSLRNFQTIRTGSYISAVGPPSEILRFGAVTFSLAIYAQLLLLLRANDSDHAEVYKAMVRPHIEFANSVWCPYKLGDIKEIEKVQKRATKLIIKPYRDRLLF